MTIVRHVFDPATGRAIFVTPDVPSSAGLDAPIGSLANQDTTGAFYAKFGPAATDWSQFAAASGFLPLTGGPLSGALTIGGDPGGAELLRVNGAARLIGGVVLGPNAVTMFDTAGVAPPSLTTRSAGTRVVLYPALSASLVDYALGIDSGTLWASVPSTAQQFRWYGGTTVAATLSGGGALTLAASLSAGATTISGSLTLSAALIFNGRSVFQSPVDGLLLLTNNVGTDFSRLMFGGTTSAFPALRRTGGSLEVVAADGSIYTTLVTGPLTVNGNANVVGDITAYRPAAPTTGVIYLNQAQTRYLFFDGSLYRLNGAGLDVGGAVSMGALTATTGTFTANVQVASTATGGTLGFGNGGAAFSYAISPNRFTVNAPLYGVSNLYGRDNAGFLLQGAGNALMWGHSNTEYRCSVGANDGDGLPYIHLFSYLTTTNSSLRSGATVRPARLGWTTTGDFFYQVGPQSGVADAAVSWTGLFQASPSLFYHYTNVSVTGNVVASTYMDAQDIAAGYRLNGAIALWRSATYTVLNDPSGGARVYLGNDGYTYYRNTNHYLQNAAGSASYLQLTATVASFYTHLTVAGGIRQTGADLVRFENTFNTMGAGGAGPGLEVGMSAGAALLQGYNRTTAAYVPMQIAASSITANANITAPDFVLA